MSASDIPIAALSAALALLIPMCFVLMIRITFWIWQNTTKLFCEIRKIKKDSSRDVSVELERRDVDNNPHVPNANDGITTSTTAHCRQVSNPCTDTDISEMVFEQTE